MSNKKELMDRARDELFSHINRCGVLQAAEEDQKQWMTETMDYLAERYPQLGDSELRELHTLGLRFCRPVIAHGRDAETDSEEEAPAAAEEAEDRSETPEDATTAA